MKKTLIGFAAALLAASLFADYVPLANTVRKLKTNKALKVAVVGDSLAYGQVCNGTTVLGVSYASRIATNPNGMPKANPMAYPRLFTDMVKREAKSRFNVADANIDTYYSTWGGATTKTTYGYFAHDIAARRPDLLLIEIWNKDSNGENLCYAEAILRTMWQASPETDILLFSAGECFALDDIKTKLVNKYQTPYFELYEPVKARFEQFGNFFAGGKCVFQPDGKLTGTCAFFYGNGFPHTTEEGYVAYSDGLSANLISLLDAAAEATGECERVAPAGSLEDEHLEGKGDFPGHATIISPASLVAAGVVDANWTATIDEVADEPRDTADRATGDKLTATVANATITTNVVGRFLFFRGCANMQVSVAGGAYQDISNGKYFNLTTGANDVTNTIVLKATAANAYINEFYVYGAATNEIPVVATKHRYSVSYFARIADAHYHDWHIGDQQIIEHPITWLNVFRDETYDTDLTVPGESVIASDCEKNGTFLGWVEPDAVTWQGAERKFTVNTHEGKKIYAAGETIDASALTGDLTLVAAYSDGPVAAECSRTFKASFMSDTTDSATTILLTNAPASSPTLTLPEVPAKPGYIIHGWREVLGSETLTAGNVYTLTNDTEFIAVYEFDRNNETGLTFAGKDVTVNYLVRNGSLRECFDAQLSGVKMGEYTSGSDEEGWNFQCNGQYHFVTKTSDNYVKATVSQNNPTYYKAPTFYGTAGIPVKMSQVTEVAVAYRYEPTNLSSPGLAGEHLNIKLISTSADGLSKIELTAQSNETILAGDNVAHFDISTTAGYTNLIDVIEIKFYDAITTAKFNLDNAFAVGPVTYTTKLVEKENSYRGLPSGYQQVEYITSDAKQWIDTGVIATMNITVAVDALCPYSWGGGPISDGDGKFRIQWSDRTHYQFYYFGGTQYPNVVENTRYLILLGKGEDGKAMFEFYTEDGVKASGKSWDMPTGATESSSLLLFAQSLTGTRAVAMTLYSCKISEDGAVLRDFVPAVRMSDSKPGLYDVQNNQFYTNINSSVKTDFTCGKNINGIAATVTKSVDLDKCKITVSFDVTSGAGDLYVTELRGGLPTEHLVKAGAKAGEQYQYTLDLSTMQEGTAVGYKTVVDGSTFTAGVLTNPFSLSPAGTVTLSEYDVTTATLTADITAVGDLSPSVDVYLAYAKSSESLPDPTIWEAGLGVCATNINLTGLSPDTGYNWKIVYQNNRDRSVTFTGSFKTNPQTGIPVVDDDPNDTPGSIRYRNLPAGYTQLESLTSNGQQLILPGVNSSAGLSITLDCIFESSWERTFVGDVTDNNGSTKNSWRLCAQNSDIKFQLPGYASSFYTKLTGGTRYTFVAGQRAAGGQLMYIYDADGQSVYASEQAKVTPTVTPSPIGIFKNGDGTQPSATTLYSLKMREDGVLKRDLVPAKYGDDYGLYDVVYGNLYTSTTAFVAASQGAAVPGVTINPTLTYVDGNWTLSLTVVSGTGDIYATEADVAENIHQKILLKVGATAGDVVQYTFPDLPENKFCTIGYMWNKPELEIKQYTTVKSFFNGSVELAKTADADEGTAASGKFMISLADDATTPSDLTVNYTVEPSSTAVAGQTYIALSGVATIPTGKGSVDVEVVPVWDPSVTTDSTVVLKLAEGEYLVGTAEAQSLTIKNGEKYGGWIYDATANTITNMIGDWSFATTDLGSQTLCVGAVATSSDVLDFSVPVVELDGTNAKRYTITELVGCFSSAADVISSAASTLTSLKLPEEGLVKIGDYAFNGCTALASVTPLLPDSVTTLGTYAFVGCPMSQAMSLKGITALTQKYSVDNCGITSVYIGPDFKTLGGGWSSPVIGHCTALTNIIFDTSITNAESATSSSEGSFLGCTAVVGTIDFSGFNSIPKYPFYNDKQKIEKFILGRGVSVTKVNLFNHIDQAALKTIIFTGNPPNGIDTEYAKLTSNTKIVTRIPGKCRSAWTAYAEGGKIPGTWASAYLPSGVSAENRPIWYKRGLVIFFN